MVICQGPSWDVSKKLKSSGGKWKWKCTIKPTVRCPESLVGNSHQAKAECNWSKEERTGMRKVRNDETCRQEVWWRAQTALTGTFPFYSAAVSHFNQSLEVIPCHPLLNYFYSTLFLESLDFTFSSCPWFEFLCYYILKLQNCVYSSLMCMSLLRTSKWKTYSSILCSYFGHNHWRLPPTYFLFWHLHHFVQTVFTGLSEICLPLNGVQTWQL